MLLLEHPLGDTDADTLNVARVAELCAAEWGLWCTTTMNLDKVRELAQGYPQLTAEQKAHVGQQVGRIPARMDSARVGDRVKWYKDVNEVK